MIVSRRANVGVTVGNCTVRSTATTAARAPGDEHGGGADEVRAHADEPSGLEVHRSRPHVQPERRAVQEQHEQREAYRRGDDGDDRDLPDLDVADRHGPVELGERGGSLPERPEPEERDALEEERDREGRGQHHRGRLRPQRPEDDALHRQRQRQDDDDAERDPHGDGPSALGGEGQREPAGHDQLAVGEVDESKHAEDEADADGHQREDRAEPDRVHLHLEIHRVAEEIGETAREHGHER